MAVNALEKFLGTYMRRRFGSSKADLIDIVRTPPALRWSASKQRRPLP